MRSRRQRSQARVTAAATGKTGRRRGAIDERVEATEDLGPHRTSADARVSNSSTVIVRSLSSGTVVPRSRSIVMRPFFWHPSHRRSSRLEEALCRRHPVETFAGRRFSRDQLLPGQRCRPADYLLGCAGLPWMVLLLEQPQQHFAYLVRIRPRSQTPGQEGQRGLVIARMSSGT